jgi:RimJ/RimL family protein N-acetyltransferase
MDGLPIRIKRGTEDDIPFVMATERGAGYEAFVGRWDERRHRSALTDGSHAYFIGYVQEQAVGFAIFKDWASPERVTLLKRIAVVDPGHGFGKRLLQAVLAAVYRETDVHRVWLGVFPENLRARKAYESVGFVAEGIARQSAFFGGIYRDEVVMSMLRTEWFESLGSR